MARPPERSAVALEGKEAHPRGAGGASAGPPAAPRAISRSAAFFQARLKTDRKEDTYPGLGRAKREAETVSQDALERGAHAVPDSRGSLFTCDHREEELIAKPADRVFSAAGTGRGKQDELTR